MTVVLPGTGGVPRASVASILGVAEALVLMGHVDQASQLLDGARAHLIDDPDDAHLAAYLELRAHLALASGRAGEALASFEAAANSFLATDPSNAWKPRLGALAAAWELRDPTCAEAYGTALASDPLAPAAVRVCGPALAREIRAPSVNNRHLLGEGLAMTDSAATRERLAQVLARVLHHHDVSDAVDTTGVAQHLVGG